MKTSDYKNSNKLDQSTWEDKYWSERKVNIMLKPGLFSSYDIYLCDSIIQKYIPKFSNRLARICEIGSGDGKLLKKIASMLGCQPLGVDYFKEAAIESANNGVRTIVADAFDKTFLKKYKNYFDVVFSYGFVEHIIPPKKAIKIHYEILKPGGYVIIQIPRLKGFNLIKAKIFRPEIIPFHNLNIMESNLLNEICQSNQIERLFCNNYGTFKFRFPMEKKNTRWYLLKAICYLEYIANPILRILFNGKGFETSFFSPAVMFIGRKKRN